MKEMQAIYMVIRYLPHVPREEFVNVGVILVCPEAGFQGIRVVETFSEGSRAMVLGGDGFFLRHSLTKLRNIIQEQRVNDLIGKKLSPEGHLSPENMTTLQQIYCNNVRFSPVRTAVTSDPAATLNLLFEEYVGEQQSETHQLVQPVSRN